MKDEKNRTVHVKNFNFDQETNEKLMKLVAHFQRKYDEMESLNGFRAKRTTIFQKDVIVIAIDRLAEQMEQESGSADVEQPAEKKGKYIIS